jgi:hypothetical protein
MLAVPPDDTGRKKTEIRVAPFGGRDTALETDIPPPAEDPEEPEGTEAVSEPIVAVTVYRSSPSPQISAIVLDRPAKMTVAVVRPKAGRVAWKC